MLGKRIKTYLNYNDQMFFLDSCGKDDLIIIFSYTGTYFEGKNLRAIERKLMHSRVWMICESNAKVPSYVDETILLNSNKDQISHPYQLQIIEGLIAQIYSVKRTKLLFICK